MTETMSNARIGVITFPGTLDDRDAARAIRLAGGQPVSLWHADGSLNDVDAVVLPGGFSYGDYLRAGAISRFAPVMEKVIDAAHGGMPVLGICNGFQVLTESHLLPGSMIKNDHLHFICREQTLAVENAETAWTNSYSHGQRIVIPLKTRMASTLLTTTPLTCSKRKTAWCSATTGGTRTVRVATLPESVTNAATWWG